MVECESSLAMVVLHPRWVLIDTWWNVNYKKQCSTHYNDGVLIDTWWNVNFTPHFTPLGTSPALIDTWWNVNLFR